MEDLRMRISFMVLMMGLGVAGGTQAGTSYVNTQSGGIYGSQIALDRFGMNRNGLSYSYSYSDLILPTITAIRQNDAPVIATYGTTYSDRNLFLRDRFLSTGLWNLPQGDGTKFDSTTQWMQITFDKPVVNSDGEDVVLFRLDWPEFMVNGPIPVRLSLDASHTILTSSSRDLVGAAMPHLPDYGYPAGPYTDPAVFGTATTTFGGYLANPTWIVQSIDLSNLGVLPGGSVSSLYLQQKNNNNTDPMLIAGLPAVPEPSMLGLGALASVLMLAFRRHHTYFVDSRGRRSQDGDAPGGHSAAN
jgi:hypothetical protein